MKNLFSLICLILTIGAFSQSSIVLPKEARDKSCKKTPANLKMNSLSLKLQELANNPKLVEAEPIGETKFDLQSNSSMQNRIYKYDDGTIGAVWTMGLYYPTNIDRGTGYNYYNGSNWGPFPTDEIEPDRTGWPSYAPWGVNGEIMVAHYSLAAVDGLVISSRENKGVGDWSFINYFGPQTPNYYLWPRAMTGGDNHSDFHLIAITAPVINGGNLYQGMDGALLYSRSPDGGVTWDHQHVLLDEINSDYYYGFSADIYEIQTQGENVAFLIGDEWTDLVLMKSSDNGDTWTKTIIWNHPYPLIDPNSTTLTDTFYCIDGSHSFAFDQSGKTHVAFGISRAHNEFGQTIWDPEVDGIGYWNEDMPSFSNNMNALSPYGDLGSELIVDYNLIGWSQDLNGNGQLDFEDDWGLYNLGVSSMPQLVIDELNNVFLVYSSVTESYSSGSTNQNCRHLWARGSNDNGQTWGDFFHLTGDMIYLISECVFPSLSPTTDNNLHLIFQKDPEPGLAAGGDADPYGFNYIEYMNIPKTDIITMVPNGFIEGMVTDASGGFLVENGTVSLEGTSYSSLTNDFGYYTITNIPIGDYEAVCTKMGYFNASADITIEEDVLTTQDFELEEAISLNPPENLSATIVGQGDVLLEWDPPVSGMPSGYHVYRNNENIGYFTTSEITDFELAPGNYEYFTTAVYEIGESGPSDTVLVFIPEPLFPPINLSALVEDNDVTLTWDSPLSGVSPTGYNIYRGFVLLNYTTVTSYLDEDLDPGNYEYYLTSVYNDEESEPTSILEVYIPAPCFPPENVIASVINITELHITWDPPGAGTPVGYNIYRDGNLVGYTDTTEMYFEEVGPGTFEFCITTICIDGESAPECADPVTIVLLPPENLIAEISGANIDLTWDEPGQKSLIGYNIYHRYEDGDFYLFAYITQNTCTYSDAEIGYHHFYVKTVYNEGESLPGDTVEILITSVAENSLEGLAIYPNPASEFVYIKGRTIIKYLKIYNHSGKVIEKLTVNSKIYKINLSRFSKGIYFFYVKADEGVISKRVIIK